MQSRKQAQADKLTRTQFETLVKLAFAQAFIQKDHQLSGANKKALKKHKKLFETCKTIMQLNADLFALFAKKKQIPQKEFDDKYTTLCTKLAECTGTSVETVKKLHTTEFQDGYPHLTLILRLQPGKNVDQVAQYNHHTTTALTEATLHCDPALASSLVDRGANPCFKPKNAIFSPTDLSIHYSAGTIIKTFSQLPQCHSQYREYYLMALRKGNEKLVQFLDKHGICFDPQLKEDEKVFKGALLISPKSTVKIVLRRIDITKISRDQKVGWLKIAAGNKDIGALQLLTEKGIAIDTTNENGYTALFRVTSLDDSVGAIIRLAKCGANLEFEASESGSTPLLYAAQTGNALSLITLMRLGAKLDVVNRFDHDVLLYLIEKNQKDLEAVIITLIEAGAPINRVYQGGYTLLYLTAQIGSAKISKHLIEKGLDPRQPCLFGNTYLHSAVTSDNPEMIDFFVDAGIDIDTMNDSGVSSLAYACYRGASKAALQLIERGADIYMPTSLGMSTIELALRYCDISVIRAIMATEGFDPNRPIQKGLSLVAMVTIEKGLKYFKALFAKTKIALSVKNGFSPLVISIAEGKDDIADWLLTYSKGNVNHLCRSGMTPLSAAISKANAEMVVKLHKNGASLTETNADGYTPLMQAAMEGYEDIVTILLQAGADPNAEATLPSLPGLQMMHVLLSDSAIYAPQDQCRALDFAALNRHGKCVDLLLKTGAKPHTQNQAACEFIDKRHKALKESAKKQRRAQASLQEIITVIKKQLKGIPSKDMERLSAKISEATPKAIKELCKKYMEKRKELIDKINKSAEELISDTETGITTRNMPNIRKLHKATIATLKNILRKLQRLQSDDNEALFDQLPSPQPSTTSYETDLLKSKPPIYPGKLKLKNFPCLTPIRRSGNFFVIPCLDVLTSSELNFKNEFLREVIDPKMARKFGSGIKKLKDCVCQVEISEEIYESTDIFEVKITQSDDRVLCYGLRPKENGPVILIPFEYVKGGLHDDETKTKREYKAPPLIKFLDVAREMQSHSTKQQAIEIVRNS